MPILKFRAFKHLSKFQSGVKSEFATRLIFFTCLLCLNDHLLSFYILQIFGKIKKPTPTTLTKKKHYSNFYSLTAPSVMILVLKLNNYYEIF